METTKRFTQHIHMAIAIAGLCVFSTLYLQAQPQGYAYTASLFSRPQESSTARARAIGGAGVALGGMMGTAALNPAGLGFFRKHAIQFSPQLSFYSNRLQLQADQAAYAIRPNVLSVSGVYSFYVGDRVPSDFRGGSMMISVTRSQDAFEKFNYLLSDAAPTLLDYYAEDAAGLSNSELAQDWQLAPLSAHHLLLPTDDGGYQSLLQGEVADQSENYKRKSAHYQVFTGYGFNYKHKFYAGASAAVGFLNHTRTRDYTEGYTHTLNQIAVNDQLRIRGESLQVSLGLIYRPVSALRLGISLHSPTLYSVREENTYDWISDFDNYIYTDPEGETQTLETLSYQSDILKGRYGLRTPFYLHTGAAYFLGKWGFVSGQLSWADYSSMRISSDDFNATTINDRIRSQYRTALNYHAGVEVRALAPWYFRMGYAYYSSIMADGEPSPRYSVGLGYQYQNQFSVSCTVEHAQQQETYAPFLLQDGAGQPATLHEETTSFLATITFFLYE